MRTDTLTLETLTFQRDEASQGAVAIVTINRPEAANALNDVMCRDLLTVAIACDEDPSIKAVLLTAAGDTIFCAGGDLTVFAKAGPNAGAMVKEMVTFLHGAITRFARMRPILITAVNGNAGGAGVSLTAMADLAIAADTASFTMAYTHVGLTPDGSSTYFLARAVGLRRAYDLALTNRSLTAAEAEDWGLVNRVVPAAELQDAALNLARQIARGPADSFAATKRLLLDSTVTTLETQLEHEATAIANAVGGAEAQEGIRAFLEKRMPDYSKG
ncbi:MAG: enoyl-CoA hydratase-related protein [Pseudomonadota bacterium]